MSEVNQRMMLLKFGPHGTQKALIDEETDTGFIIRRYNATHNEYYPAKRIAKSDIRILSVDGVEYTPTAKKAVAAAKLKASTFIKRLTGAMAKGCRKWVKNYYEDIIINRSDIKKFLLLESFPTGPVVAEFDDINALCDYLCTVIVSYSYHTVEINSDGFIYIFAGCGKDFGYYIKLVF